ncbi:MAG: FtsX-like permease family protein, partial [Erysipelotrichaceae bacterium]
FSADTLLKKRNYGIYLSNGYSRFEIIRIIFNKITIIVFSSTIISYLYKYLNLLKSDSISIKLFKNILFKSHIYYSLPMGILSGFVIVIVSVIIPAVNIFKFEPHELISGENSR